MALPGITELKRRLRIEHTAEDTDLTAMMASAYGVVQSYVKRPLVAVQQTMYLEEPPFLNERRHRVLYLPVYPVLGTPTPTLTDNDGTLVATSDYRLDLSTGIIYGLATTSAFAVYPYTVVATVGLSARSDYALVVEPVLGAAIIDHAADLWHARNPRATNESTGGGVSTSYATETGLSARLKAMLDPFRMARAR